MPAPRPTHVLILAECPCDGGHVIAVVCISTEKWLSYCTVCGRGWSALSNQSPMLIDSVAPEGARLPLRGELEHLRVREALATSATIPLKEFKYRTLTQERGFPYYRRTRRRTRHRPTFHNEFLGQMYSQFIRRARTQESVAELALEFSSTEHQREWLDATFVSVWGHYVSLHLDTGRQARVELRSSRKADFGKVFARVEGLTLINQPGVVASVFEDAGFAVYPSPDKNCTALQQALTRTWRKLAQ